MTPEEYDAYMARHDEKNRSYRDHIDSLRAMGIRHPHIHVRTLEGWACALKCVPPSWKLYGSWSSADDDDYDLGEMYMIGQELLMECPEFVMCTDLVSFPISCLEEMGE